MQIFLEGFSCLGMDWFMSNVWVLFVSGTLIVLWTMGFPVSQAHPAEVMFAVITLHVIAAPILLNADVTTRTLKPKFIGLITKSTIIMQRFQYNTVYTSSPGDRIRMVIYFRLQPLYPQMLWPPKNTSTWQHQH